MKKLFIISLLLFSIIRLDAQQLTTFIRPCSKHYIELRNIMQTRDGNIIANCPLFNIEEGMDIGFILYKISLQGELLDSIYVKNNDIMWSLMERNPLNEDNNVMATITRDFDDTTTSLKISFFNDDLDFEDDIYVPLEDTIARLDDYYLDKNNDIIVNYYARKHLNIARVGLDSTLKDKVTLPSIPAINFYQSNHFGLYNESPLEYCLWGADFYSNLSLSFVVMDSLFEIKDEVQIKPIYDGGNSEQILYFNDSTY